MACVWPVLVDCCYCTVGVTAILVAHTTDRKTKCACLIARRHSLKLAIGASTKSLQQKMRNDALSWSRRKYPRERRSPEIVTRPGF